jgi:hypothetical protein
MWEHYDAYIVFILSFGFCAIYIFSEAKPLGSSLLKKVLGPFGRFF